MKIPNLVALHAERFDLRNKSNENNFSPIGAQWPMCKLNELFPEFPFVLGLTGVIISRCTYTVLEDPMRYTTQTNSSYTLGWCKNVNYLRIFGAPPDIV